MTRITDKRQMYQLLSAGKLGNTIPQFFDRGVWSRFVGDHVDKYPRWGVRDAITANSPRSRLNVPTPEVYRLLDDWFPSGIGFNLSPMIRRYIQFDCQLDGRTIEWINPRYKTLYEQTPHPWRTGFQHWREESDSETIRRALLDTYLWPAAREQLDQLLEKYPDHVVEFSACDCACGLEPLNNMIVWEVRAY